MKFCNNCGVSNQRPNSAVNLRTMLIQKKKQYSLMQIKFATPVGQLSEKVKKLIGKQGNVISEIYVTNFGVAMDHMIAWCPVLVAKIVFTSPGS